jgi:proton glutamate symport protein
LKRSKPIRISQPTRILLALVLGLAAGIASVATHGAWIDRAVAIAEPIGGMWLNALQMTIVPLVVSLLITGIAASAEAARASRLATRALILFVVLLWISSIMAALLTPLLLGWFPIPAESGEALRGALATAEPVGNAPGFGDFLRSIVPTNPIAAASESAILPLIVFVVIFAFAMIRLPEEPRKTLTGFFQAVADTMLIVIGWVLWIGPIGVFALAYVVGARAGATAFGALLHYVIILVAVGSVMWLSAWPLAWFGARVSPIRFTKAVAASQALAFSTQSSLACLPAMLRANAKLGVPVEASGITLPMAVALFRATGPCMNLAVAIYVAYLMNVPLTPMALAFGVAAAALTTMGAVGIPGQASFVTSIAPICFAMGVPIEPLAILIAIEVIPDLMRTMGNVSMDVAATTVVSKRSGFKEADATSEEDRLLMETV